MEQRLIELLDLQGKVAIVTGGAQGIGRGIVETLSAAGAQVVIADRNQAEAAAVAAALERHGRHALVVEVDVADEPSVRAMIQRVVDQLKRVDILVNNAGVFPMSTLRELDAATWESHAGSEFAWRLFVYAVRGGTHDCWPRRGENHQHLNHQHRAYLCRHGTLRCQQGGPECVDQSRGA